MRVSTGSKPASSSRFTTSCGATQLRIGLRGFSRSSSASPNTGRQTRLYELTITRVRSCECAATRSEELEQVVDVRHQVGEDDVVERLAELAAPRRGPVSNRSSGCPARARSTIPCADVDADADARLERGEQVARARSRSRAPGRLPGRGSASPGRSGGGTCCSGASSGTPRSRTGRRTPPALRRGPPSRPWRGRLRWP